MKSFIETNKLFLSIYSIWLLINFAMWFYVDNENNIMLNKLSSATWRVDYDKLPSKEHFWPFQYGSMAQCWNLPEVLVYGIGPLLIYILFTVAKNSKK